MEPNPPVDFIFFGSDSFSIRVLEELLRGGFSPKLVVTVPDRPKGRGLATTPPPVKVWAESRKIGIIQPASLSDSSVGSELSKFNAKLFIVASYGKIIPKSILKIPERGTLNVHPSLLPKFRGASPIQSAILSDEQTTGVTIMLMDEKMDHGPIVARKEIKVSPWPISSSELEEMLGNEGGALLTDVVREWVSGSRTAEVQDEQKATFTKKFEKRDACIDLSEDAYRNFLKIKAFDRDPVAYTNVLRNGKTIRLLIKDAVYEGGSLRLTRVIPEGKREMSYEDFLRGSGISKS